MSIIIDFNSLQRKPLLDSIFTRVIGQRMFAISSSFVPNSLILMSVLLLSPTLLFASQPDSNVDFPRLDVISTSSARQIVKERTASAYIFEHENDFDKDGVNEIIVGANCIEGFCLNFIFRKLHNNRVQFLGHANFHHEYYELVWKKDSGLADIIYFRQENVGQGCIGRYHYVEGFGYKLQTETCRLPKAVKESLNSYALPQKPVPVPVKKERDLDVIDFSDIEFDDEPADFFPEEEAP